VRGCEGDIEGKKVTHYVGGGFTPPCLFDKEGILQEKKSYPGGYTPHYLFGKERDIGRVKKLPL
jgi:hypothetical protein